jgi:hypothetical protein
MIAIIVDQCYLVLARGEQPLLVPLFLVVAHSIINSSCC